MPPVWIVLIMLPLLGGAERFNCRGRILGAYYADAKSGCKAFHVCVRVAGGGVRDFRFFCPPGTLFHQEAQTCTDWGDDDPLACPADLYDGQFDLYKIGSGYDTKKLSSQGNRDEESEFGLQRAETGDRRSQNNGGSGAASDLRTAHSSDFFSGQRDRGRDEQSTLRPAPSASPTSHRQSFRRVPSSRAPSTTYASTPSSQKQSDVPNYESHSKRKLVRKRPIYVSSTQPPTTFAHILPSQSEQQFNQQRSLSQQNQQQNNQHKQQKQQFSTPQQAFSQKPQPSFQTPKQSIPKVSQQSYSEQPQQNFNQRVPQKTTTLTTPPPPTNLPAQYKDEYVEVSRVAPIKKNRYYINTPTPSGLSQTSSPYFNKKDGLAELYNYNSQSTPALNAQNENKPFKLRNSFNVQDSPTDDFARINANYQPNYGRGTPSTAAADYNSASTRASASSTPDYKNFNSVSYEPEKNNFVQYNNKQNYFNSPTTTPVPTTYYATVRSNPLKRLNTVAYNTNNALNTVQQSNFADNNEDDGQYRLPEGEDDGQYRPELYERELLSGAHSLNIAASGNRVPEDQKQSAKSQIHSKPTSQVPIPRPFRPAPTQSLPPVPTTRTAEPTYTTTFKAPTVSTERTFDQYKSYTTTSRPEPSAPEVSFNFPVVSNAPARPTSTAAPRTPEPRPPSRPPAPSSRPPAPPSSAPPRPSTRAPLQAKPNNKEDSSYDYAYYDSDPGFTEYDHIEEFGRTKKRT